MSRLFLFAVLCVIATVACTTTAPERTPPRSDGAATAPAAAMAPDQGAPPMFAPSVPEPKDARGIPPCDLLTDDQLRQLDLLPDSATGAGDAVVQTCAWTSATDATNPVGLEINTDSTLAALDIIYNTRDVVERFEPTEVAGHPAVRADYFADNSCTLAIGIADHQGIGIQANGANRPLPDPCDIPRRMGEFILSNLPPLT
ncbi:hypothetical protein GCM10017691_16260 [Pseudonocardia petroleophila]|uniref:DUF3558 domain-containing protein n=1 Tax=Pseudonocardia petroleophila TaxID=37331 RepID=A0A7G7MHP3_9PSEU|nr:DUF3558 domain-containing protein [Pseudonocardia petroleophila]QNG52304.1 DUF3558 domain-containing protein [Pseudonocardia petroleophila]